MAFFVDMLADCSENTLTLRRDLRPLAVFDRLNYGPLCRAVLKALIVGSIPGPIAGSIAEKSGGSLSAHVLGWPVVRAETEFPIGFRMFVLPAFRPAGLGCCGLASCFDPVQPLKHARCRLHLVIVDLAHLEISLQKRPTRGEEWH